MLLTLIVFIVVLGLLVFVHELGHFITAKRAGVGVEEFGFGFPPRIIGVRKNPDNKWELVGRSARDISSTIYSLNWVPLGGFVKIKGEQGESANEKDSFAYQKPGRRIWILSSGVLMNVVLTIVLLSVGFFVGLPQVIEDQQANGARITQSKIQVMEVIDRLPAQKQGVQMGDSLVTIDGQIFNEITDIQNYIDGRVGQPVNLVLARGQESVEKIIVPEIIPETNRGGLGVALVKTGLVSYPWYQAIWQGLLATFFLVQAIIFAFYELFKNLILSQQVAVDVAGPVGIAVLTGQVTRLGFIYIMQFTALLSLNLAIINFLPFPALDGGRVFFILIEKIRGRAINQKIENFAHNLGFALLMILVLLITFRDISKVSHRFTELINYINDSV